MKKSLVILSISLILLISISFVSASWFSDWLNGDVARTMGGGAGLETKRVSSDSEGTSAKGMSTGAPAGWAPVVAADGRTCYIQQKPAQRKSLFVNGEGTAQESPHEAGTKKRLIGNR